MKLIDALTVLRDDPPAGAGPLDVSLACGCTPLHLQTFLAAYLRILHPDRRVAVRTGLYGDCLGNIERLPRARPNAAAVVLEWPDFDPRLGLRHLGGWGPGDLADILATVEGRAARFQEAITRAAEVSPIALCLPTLPLPPVTYLPGRQAGPFDLGLRECLGRLAARAASVRGVRVVNPQHLDRESPPSDRLDVKSELSMGFPYRLSHASTVAGLLARLLGPPAPKKGLVTDLDDTLWRGILGDIGVRGVSWDLDHHSQIHGLYQQLLRSLAEAGVLIAAASKNDPDLVEETLRRADLILPRDRLFPLEVRWGPKSESVGRILRAWNIAADSVVFVDDSPMELAEVQAAHPGLECLLFPARDDQAAYDLLGRLRDLFGKDAVSREDALRLESLRRADPLLEAAGERGAPPDRFLEQAEAEITLDFGRDEADPRTLELVNKTNQFNLNGRRYTEGDWREQLRRPDAFLLRVAYRDKYGPLGTIAVLAGRHSAGTLAVDTWVMSCRAFSRRIEHRCLEQLFARFGTEQIAFDFQPTPRNGPLRDFFAELLGHAPEPGFQLARAAFVARCSPLFHRLRDATHD